ncbi:hydrogenase maturation nickel metallochaperone HypA [Atlantibacter subterranea]|uniref:hydrogenase maturation nickel metallochaperone HypA n=1 Tax=Atlantibacter subterraneus TaxID=255519 RepID=UPI0011823B72|nr:hydrogenase maturation nickel metallochaperone HypA [Atlantibacter subterranea]TSJ53714.1 hydrogenase maturation nickel metallochaperone HypA [Atlantibacter subterranea]
MHELSLAQGVIQLLEDQAATGHFQRITHVWLDVGALACVELSSLQFGLEVARRGTVASEAQFHIDIAPAKGWCFACDSAFSAEQHASPCPHCGSWEIQIDKGNAMRVREMEVE